MPSPFPGMDPYLESATIWEDFYTSLAAEIRNALTPKLRPHFIAAIEPQVQYDKVTIHDVPVARHKIRPDIGVFKPRTSYLAEGGALVVEKPAPVMVHIPAPYRAKVAIDEPAAPQHRNSSNRNG